MEKRERQGARHKAPLHAPASPQLLSESSHRWLTSLALCAAAMVMPESRGECA
jgi:hypothetical protein